jgi:hypothetical protein
MRWGIVCLALSVSACNGQVERDVPGDVELMKLKVGFGCGNPEVALHVDYENSTSLPTAWNLDSARLDFGGKWVWQLSFTPPTSGVIAPGAEAMVEHHNLPGGGPLHVTDDCYNFCGKDWTIAMTWSTPAGETEQLDASGEIHCPK